MISDATINAAGRFIQGLPLMTAAEKSQVLASLLAVAYAEGLQEGAAIVVSNQVAAQVIERAKQ